MLPVNLDQGPLPMSGMDPSAFATPNLQRGGMFGGGMFGGGKFGVGQAIVAALNGYLASRHNPVGLQNMQMMQQMAQQKREEALYQQRHQQALQDQMSLYDYKAKHPDTPDIQQRIDALNAIKPGLGDTYAQNYAQNGGGSMVQFVDPATGQRYMTPQMPAIGSVVADPRKGGPTPQASGGFPGY